MMDSARDFDLLGESVPQAPVSARTLAPLGFFRLQFILTPFFPEKYIYLKRFTVEGKRYKARKNTALMLKAITPFKAFRLVLHQESTPGK